VLIVVSTGNARGSALVFTVCSFGPRQFDRYGLGGIRVVAMHRPLLIVLTAVVLLIVSAVALMNNACKSSQHEWCAPMSALKHHLKTEHS
jgi:hypothetical protein